MENCVWSRALLFDFIETYKHYKCLWLKTDHNYYNKRQKTKAYRKLVHLIQDDFPNADELFVKTKIKNIRCAFRKAFKKQMSKNINESRIYKPKLWYFDLLMFTVVDNNNPATTEDEQDDENRLAVEN